MYAATALLRLIFHRGKGLPEKIPALMVPFDFVLLQRSANSGIGPDFKFRGCWHDAILKFDDTSSQ